MTSKPYLKVCKFGKLILLIRDIKSITSDVLDLLVFAKLYYADKSFSNSVVNKWFHRKIPFK